MVNRTRPSPRLSIGLPVYNGERLLPQAIECLLAQTFGDFEIVIGDNASTDRTREICQDYVRRDRRIRYVRHEHNLGAVANFNRVFELSPSHLFKWAAHDDLHRETYLESCVKLLDRNPDAILAHTGTAFVDEFGQPFPFDLNSGAYIDPRTGVRHEADGPEVGDSASPSARFLYLWSKSNEYHYPSCRDSSLRTRSRRTPRDIEQIALSANAHSRCARRRHGKLSCLGRRVYLARWGQRMRNGHQ
jgi:glycosyltransferase involved in cell wall biosynthesis